MGNTELNSEVIHRANFIFILTRYKIIIKKKNIDAPSGLRSFPKSINLKY